tara:strand:- start:335 stop:649 length:315 start_codon:yes stop_codon:yes gene_type:complete
MTERNWDNYFSGLYELSNVDLLAKENGEASLLIDYLDGVLEEYDIVVDRLTSHLLKRHVHPEIPYEPSLREARSKLHESIEPNTHIPYKELINRRDFLRAKVSR